MRQITVLTVLISLIPLIATAQVIDQTRGVDPRVDYKALTRFGPWDDRNYQLTLDDLKVLAPNEHELHARIPAFFRVELRKNWPQLLREGPAQYPRSAYQIFRILHGSRLVNGVYQGPTIEQRKRMGLKVGQEVRLSDVTGAHESAVEISPTDPDRLIAGANSGGYGQEMYHSSDGGETWTVTALSGNTCCDPTMGWSSDGTLAYTATLGNCGSSGCGVWFYRSTDHGETWSQPLVITSSGSDKEFLHVDHSANSPYLDYVYLTWHDNNVMKFARSRNRGQSFDATVSFQSEPLGIGSDITTDRDGAIYYFWPGTSTRKIHMAKSTNGGGTFSSAVDVANTMASFDFPIPSQESRYAWIYVSAACDLSDGPYSGKVYAAWTDTAAADTNTAAQNHARIVLAHSADGGQTFETTIPHPTHDILQVDRWNQWMDVDAQGTVHLVYYDTQRDPNRRKVDLFYTYSTDGGETFSTPERLTSVMSDNLDDGMEFGDYNGLSAGTDEFFTVWTDNRVEGARADSKDVYGMARSNPAADPDFGIQINPAQVQVCAPGQVQNIAVDITSILGFDQPVTLSAPSLPGGVTAQFSGSPITPPGQAQLTLIVDSSATASNTDVIIRGTSTSGTHDAILGLLITSDTPIAPQLLTPPDGGDGGWPTVTLTWSEVSGATSYHVLAASDQGFTQILLDQMVPDARATLTGLSQGQRVWWNVSSTNGCGTGDDSVTFSFTASGENILLVDQDDNNPDVRHYFTDTLDALGEAYQVFDVATSGSPQLVDLEPFSVVIWFSGLRFSGPDDQDQDVLNAYLSGGGRLFLSSQDYLYPYDGDVPGFARDALGVESVNNDNGGYGQVNGSGIFQGLSALNLEYPFDDFSDSISATASASLDMVGGNGRGAGITTDQTVFFAFPFPALAANTPARMTSPDAQQVMTAILEHFSPEIPCTINATPVSFQFDSDAGDGTVTVTAPSHCPWNATSQSTWITVTSGSTGMGSQNLTFHVTENTSTDARMGSLSVDDTSITVEQAGAEGCVTPPTAAQAGPDQHVVGTQTTLQANTPVSGTGAWQILQGVGGILSQPTNPQTPFQGQLGQTYQLRWTISLPPCPESSDDVLVSFADSSTSVSLNLPQDLSATPSAPVTLPVTVGALQGSEILAFAMTLRFDPDLLSFTAVDSQGTLTASWQILSNVSSPGELLLAGSHTQPLTGSGLLMNLQFVVTEGAIPGNCCTLELADVQFNEGDPPSAPQNGQFCVADPCLRGDVTGDGSISAFDATQILRHVIGMATPFDPLPLCAADTSCSGTISAYDASLTLQYAVGLITEFCATPGAPAREAIDVHFPHMEVGQTQVMIELPLILSDATHLVVQSFQCTLDYDPQLLDLQEVLPGPLMQDWTMDFNLIRPGRVNVAGFAPYPLQGEGVLFTLNVLGLERGTSPVVVQAIMFNEGAPSAISRDGSVRVNPPCTPLTQVQDFLHAWPHTQNVLDLLEHVGCSEDD